MLFDLLVNTGLRRGEALALKWSDVDFTKSLIRVRGTLARVDGDLVVTKPKTEKSRRVIHMSPAPERVFRAVKRRQMEDRLRAGSIWATTDFVFTTETGSRATRGMRSGPSRRRRATPACHAVSASTRSGTRRQP